jgi:hypothetical protein
LGFGLADGNGAPDAPGTHWEFLGLLPLFDPPRHDTAETIKRCQHMGIGGEQTCNICCLLAASDFWSTAIAQQT